MMMRRIFFLAFALVALSTAAASAQRGDGLDERNAAFLRTVERGNRDSIAAFFPRAGGWTWTQTLLHAPLGRALVVRRFPAAATRSAIGAGGEACWQFEEGHGGMGQPETYFSMQVRMNGTAWRRVRGSRFVPPGEAANAPTFVEWRREDGRWAVSAIGDVGFYGGPRLLGRPAWERMLDTITLLPPSPVYAAGERWFVNNEPFNFAGRLYIKYGLARRIDPGLLRRVGRFGMIGIYGDPALPASRRLDVIYVPTAPGEYQVYQVPETMPDCGG